VRIQRSPRPDARRVNAVVAVVLGISCHQESEALMIVNPTTYAIITSNAMLNADIVDSLVDKPRRLALQEHD
jgi:hypothetical protein